MFSSSSSFSLCFIFLLLPSLCFSSFAFVYGKILERPKNACILMLKRYDNHVCNYRRLCACSDVQCATRPILIRTFLFSFSLSVPDSCTPVLHCSLLRYLYVCVCESEVVYSESLQNLNLITNRATNARFNKWKTERNNGDSTELKGKNIERKNKKNELTAQHHHQQQQMHPARATQTNNMNKRIRGKKHTKELGIEDGNIF